MIDTMYEYRYERENLKVLEQCDECGCNLHKGDEAIEIGIYIFCRECVKEIILEDEE